MHLLDTKTIDVMDLFILVLDLHPFVAFPGWQRVKLPLLTLLLASLVLQLLLLLR